MQTHVLPSRVLLATEVLRAAGRYEARCRDAGGSTMWRVAFDNLLMDAGKNALLDAALGGVGFTAAWHVALIVAGAPAAGATYAAPVVTEAAAGVLAARVALAFAPAAAGQKTATTAQCNILGPATILGAMVLAGSAVPGDVAAVGGVLLSAGLFGGGGRAVQAGDTLSLSWSLAI